MPFVKGKSGNPAGQTAAQANGRKQTARLIGYLTGDGAELVRRLLLMSRGITTPEELAKLGGDEAFADGRLAPNLSADRVKMAHNATSELFDRFAGKPSQHVEVEDVTDPVAALDARLAALTPEQIAALAVLDDSEAATGTSGDRGANLEPGAGADAPALH